MSEIYKIGHSNYDINKFIGLLLHNDVNAVADVRSSPYSKWVPQYSREALKATLLANGIAYTFLGKEFGARSDNPNCYVNGRVQYSRLAEEPAFEIGVARLREGVKKFRIALMCAEKDPIDCHRAILVARELDERGFMIRHILPSGECETQRQLELRLLSKFKLPANDLVSGREFVDRAYQKQEDRVAYQDDQEVRNNGGVE